MKNSIVVVLGAMLIGGSSAGYAQTMVEYTLGVGRAGAAAGGMRGVSKEAGKVFEGVTQTLKQSSTGGQQTSVQRGTVTEVRTVRPAPVQEKKPAPKVTYEDPKKIEEGLAYDELVRRFGEPSMKLTGATGETLYYTAKDAEVSLIIRDGKVANLKNTSKPDQRAGVVSLQ